MKFWGSGGGGSKRHRYDKILIQVDRKIGGEIVSVMMLISFTVKSFIFFG